MLVTVTVGLHESLHAMYLLENACEEEFSNKVFYNFSVQPSPISSPRGVNEDPHFSDRGHTESEEMTETVYIPADCADLLAESDGN